MLSASAIRRGQLPSPVDGATLCTIAEQELRVAGYMALRDVRCELHGGALRLRGRLRSQYLKQVAQTVVSRIAGQTQLENAIEIVGQTPRSPRPSVSAGGPAPSGTVV